MRIPIFDGDHDKTPLGFLELPDDVAALMAAGMLNGTRYEIGRAGVNIFGGRFQLASVSIVPVAATPSILWTEHKPTPPPAGSNQ
jgi:hypothetical protein